jgi:tetratricopeptide (TPR) repeat protein
MATAQRSKRSRSEAPSIGSSGLRSAAGAQVKNGLSTVAPETRPEVARYFFITVALTALNAILYAPVVRYGFVDYDDPAYVWDNPHVFRGLSWHSVAWAFTHGYASNWHPLTWISHMADVQAYGLHGGPHHLTNLIFHVANTILLFLLLGRLTGALGRSAVVAALFAAHPLHVESVAWVSERKDVLSTFFCLLTLLAYVAYVRRHTVLRYAAVLLLFACALMAKPMVVTLPFALLLLDYWPLRRIPLPARGSGWRDVVKSRELPFAWFRLILEKTPLVLLSAASSVITFGVQRHWGSVWTSDTLPFRHRLANALISYVVYVRDTVWPARLAAFYPYRVSFPVWWVIAAAALLIVVCGLVVAAGRRHPYLPVGWFWYLGTLVPAIGLVQVGWQSMADRYTYVPLIGLFVIAAWGLTELVGNWHLGKVACASAGMIAIMACAAATRIQVRYWTSDIALWEHALQVTSGNYVAHNNLGVDFNNVRRFDEAIPHYVQAMRLKPDYPDPHNNFGLTLANMGKTDLAIAEYREALRLNPGYPDAHNNLGVALASQGQLEEAIGHYETALRGNSDYAAAHNNWGLALAAEGKFKEAIPHYEAALDIQPRYPDARNNLAVAMASMDKPITNPTPVEEAKTGKPAAPPKPGKALETLVERRKEDSQIFDYLRAVRDHPNSRPELLRKLNDLVNQKNAATPQGAGN